jgi:hypothetical protein
MILLLQNTDIKFIKTWLLAAGQYDGSSSVKHSRIAIDLRPVVTQNEIFHEWVERVLILNIGAETAQGTGGTPP